jgi:subtilase family serine protease
MRRALAFCAALAVLAAPAGPSALKADPPAPSDHAHGRPVCPGPAFATAVCGAEVVSDIDGTPLATTGPSGLSPAQLHSAYSLPNNGPTVQKVAVITAYDAPTIANDLATFSSTYGLPACTIANGCLTKYNQSGKTSGFPAADSNWALETSLDVETVHAICQNCKIVLIEATNASLSNILAAVDRAVTLRVNVIVNSYGFLEFASETSYDSHFNKTGIAITASSGDSGYGTQWPAASQYVTAVGGTTLALNADGTRASETAWAGAGSGCSLYEPKPTWQKDTGCAKRTVADVSADADPASGMSVYDSTPYQGYTGWFRVGGTSLAAPIVGSIYALAGNTTSIKYGSYPYTHTAGLFDPIAGSNGSCGTYLCNGALGFDGPTGLGSPTGVSGF